MEIVEHVRCTRQDVTLWGRYQIKTMWLACRKIQEEPGSNVHFGGLSTKYPSVVRVNYIYMMM
jgi:hypothetical protein